jgi:hypothetical protein
MAPTQPPVDNLPAPLDVEGVEEGVVPDLDELGVRERAETIDRTRAHIAKTLTYATIGISGAIGLVLTACVARFAWVGKIEEADVQRLTPLVTLVISQTLVPLTTIAITWYFASRSFEEGNKSRRGRD